MPGSCLVAQLGARMHYAVPRLLFEAGHLDRFYTDICAVKGWPKLLNLVPRNLRGAGMKRLLGRVPQGIPASHISAFTDFGREYSRRRNAAKSASDATAAHLWAGQTFCEHILKAGFGSASHVYAFNSAALELLCEARHRGLRAVVEQTIAPKQIERELLRAEGEKFPGWEAPQEDDLYADAFIARERAEWEAADAILCGSEFVREGIARCGGPVAKCIVVPYGVDVFFQIAEREPHRGPLRVLTIGAVGLRKGSPYVLAASKALAGRARFRMVGSVGIQAEALAALREHVEVTGPVPRSEILEHYRWADVFLMPSMCEGSATVCYEALACGLPVVTTPNTGTVVQDGREGFVVRAGETAELVSRLEQLAENPGLREEMSRRAASRARQYDLAHYSQSLLDACGLAPSRTSASSSMKGCRAAA